jgi:hypothetical protein
MTTSGQTVLSGRDHLNVRELDDAASVVAELRAVNVANGDPARGGLVWHFQLGDDESSPALVAGVRGEVGAVAWYEGVDELTPVDGTNDDWAAYWTWSGHEFPMRPGTEIPLSEVCAAVEQLIRTRRRPDRIGWRSIA